MRIKIYRAKRDAYYNDMTHPKGEIIVAFWTEIARKECVPIYSATQGAMKTFWKGWFLNGDYEPLYEYDETLLTTD